MLCSRTPTAYARPLKLTVGAHGFIFFSILCVLAAGEIPLVRYLVKYSYLPTSTLESNQLRSSEEIEQAIRDLQFMGGLKQTGHIDKQTVDLMKMPRCGVTDNVKLLREHSSAAAALSQHHPASDAARAASRQGLPELAKMDSSLPKSISWTITEYTSLLRQGDTHRILKAAFEVWGAVAPLTFQEVAPNPSTDSGRADVRIKFAQRNHGDSDPFDGKGGTLAHAFFPEQPVNGGEVHFDSEEEWVVSNTQAGSHLPFVAVHELGHAIGVKHTPALGSVMYPFYKKPKTDTIILQPADVEGITALYGIRSDVLQTGPPPPPPPPPPTSALRPVTWAPPITMTESPVTASKLPPTDNIPWQCKTKFDAITIIRREIMSFKGKSMWRTRKDGTPAYGRPIDTGSFFVGLPPATTWTNVDEVFELSNNDIVFFIGRRYFLFDGRRLKGRFPAQGKPITDFGLPESLERIDAMFRWGLDGMTYIISGNLHWKYDEKMKIVFPGYPREMSVWKGVQLPVDAAFQSYNGTTYFFNGLKFWEFDDNIMSVAAGYPKWANTAWLGCPPGSQSTVLQLGDSV